VKLRQLRNRRREDEDTGLWQLSFADMVTLILAFFIVVVSISKVDLARYERVAQSMEKAMGPKETRAKEEKRPGQGNWSKLGEALERRNSDAPEDNSRVVRAISEEEIRAHHQKLETLDSIVDDLQFQLALDLDSITLERRESSVSVSLLGGIFFQPGSAALTDKAMLLSIVAEVLSGLPYKVTVEGHTDNTPISTPAFPSNWELSAARAASVARFLIHQGINSRLVKIVGYGDTRPRVPNLDPDGNPLPENQKLNRRVVILIEP